MQLAWCPHMNPKKPLQYIYYIHGLWPLYYCHDMNWQFHQLDLAGFMHGKTGSQVLVIHERLKTFTYRERFSMVFMSTSNHFQAGLDGRSLRISGCVWEPREDWRSNPPPADWEMDKLNDQTNTRWVRWFFPCIWIHFIIHLVYLKLVAGYCLMIV